MKAHNLKYLFWEVTTEFTTASEQNMKAIMDGIDFIETNGKNSKLLLRKHKKWLLETFDFTNDLEFLGLEVQKISCKAKYIPFEKARERAEELLEEGKLSKEHIEHFGLN